jgi:TPR repeat protein
MPSPIRTVHVLALVLAASIGCKSPVSIASGQTPNTPTQGAFVDSIEKLANDGDPKAQNLMGILRHQGTPQAQHNDAEAFVWFEKSAKQGNPDGETNLGGMYERGLGVNRNYQSALLWYQKAADHGSASAIFNIGSLFANGQGVPKDQAKAISYYMEGGEKGSTEAQLSLARMFEFGWRVKQDDGQAAYWYRKAAERGNSDAEFSLGKMLFDGRGADQSYSESMDWFKKAAEHGNSWAYGELARFYDSGLGVPQDKAQVQFYIRKILSEAGKKSDKPLDGLNIAHERRATIGISMQSVTPEMAGALGMPNSGGTIIANVVPGGRAAQAGLKAGDVILEFEDFPKPVFGILPTLLADMPDTSDIHMQIWRNGSKMAILIPGKD